MGSAIDHFVAMRFEACLEFFLERKTGMAVGFCRGIVEGSAVLAGWLLGGPVGLGTVLAAFGISFCIQVVFRLLKFDAKAVRHETLDATWRKLLPADEG